MNCRNKHNLLNIYDFRTIYPAMVEVLDQFSRLCTHMGLPFDGASQFRKKLFLEKSSRQFGSVLL